MLKIVEASDRCPVRFPIKPGARVIAGQCAQVTEFDGNLVIEPSDGKRVFGLVGNSRKGDVFSFGNIVKVWTQRMIFRTDKFVGKMATGNVLYCDSNGYLTIDKPFDNALFVARVITPPQGDREWMEAVWI